MRFYVPGPDDSESSDSGSWATAPAETSNSPGSTGALKEQIEFLCPNGHRVWAPIALQGRAGQCPECGSKFHIPTLADYEDMPLDILPSEDSVVNLDPLTSLQSNGNSSSHASGPLSLPGSREPVAAVPNSCDATAKFLADLVADLPEGAVVELLTTDGRKYVPSQLARKLCDSTRLAFSAKADDDSHSLVVLPWPSIARIEVLGLKELPVEFRE